MAEVITETERLRLREWDDADEARFHEIMNKPTVMRWLGGVQSAEEWNAAYQRLRTYQQEWGHTFWIIEGRADGEMLGFCGLKRANAPGAGQVTGEYEIGWRLREDAWGQGIAKEAAVASLDLAFERFGAPRVIAMTALRNQPSQHLMIRLGMTRRKDLDFMHTAFAPDSEVNPQIIYLIEAPDWPQARVAALG